MREGPKDFTSDQNLEPTCFLITQACMNFPIHQLPATTGSTRKLLQEDTLQRRFSSPDTAAQPSSCPCFSFFEGAQVVTHWSEGDVSSFFLPCTGVCAACF